MIGLLKKIIKGIIKSSISSDEYLIQQNRDKERILLAKSLIVQHAKLDKVRYLEQVEFSAFSQWGEDGIIQYLISFLGNIQKSFIEFGVGDYKESNTRLLLCSNNWRGLVIDGSAHNIQNIRNQDIFWRYDLSAIQSFITCHNINSLIVDSGFRGDIGLLSIDIDGNDYWLWDSINVVNPVIVICEYNAILGDIHALTIPYIEDFYRTSSHYSNLYFGASICALIDLANKKGYTFLGTSMNGCNAFFIRNDCIGDLSGKFEFGWASPSKVRESRDDLGYLTYLSGSKRVNEIRSLTLLDTRNNNLTTLEQLEKIYSDEWIFGHKSRIQ